MQKLKNGEKDKEMPEFTGHVSRPDLAQVTSISEARFRRTQGLKSAVKINRTTQHTEGILFKSSLDELFGSHELADQYVGEPLLMSKAETSEVPIARVHEEQYEDGHTHFTVVVSPEEYEWLTINLEHFEPKKDLDKQIGSQLGRYYRLTQAVKYILESRGYTNYDNIALHTQMEIDDMIIDFTPEEDSRGRKDIAKLRIAGGYVLSAMQLDEKQDSDFRDYLQYSIEERLSYSLGTMRFAAQQRLPLPPDLDTDMSHWMGTCLPLDISKTETTVPLWEPDSTLL
jgi:hypothetical protein